MTYVSNSANLKAKQIAQELDRHDGKSDNLITADTWNNVFKAKEKGGKEIRSCISVFNAEKSIKTYLKRNALSESGRNDVGEAWLQDVVNPKSGENPDDPPKNGNEQRTALLSGIASYTPAPFVEQPVSTAVYRGPEIVIIGDASASKRASEAFAKLKDASRDTESIIKQELAKKGIPESVVDIPYWSHRIATVSSKYSIPKEIIVSIISKETGFRKNIANSYGKGAMALTGIAIRSFFPSGQGNWNDIYQQLDNELLQDILYKKDANGDFIKDANGNYVLKYHSSQELLAACGKDDELSIKVGYLIFEMKYAEAVAEKKYGRSTYANVPKVIDQLKSGELTLTEEENIACVGQAVKNYNGCSTMVRRHGKLVAIKDDYKRDVMDSLKVYGYNFAEQNIIKRT